MISNSKIIVIWSSTVTDNQKTLSLLISLQIQSIFTPVFTFPTVCGKTFFFFAMTSMYILYNAQLYYYYY